MSKSEARKKKKAKAEVMETEEMVELEALDEGEADEAESVEAEPVEAMDAEDAAEPEEVLVSAAQLEAAEAERDGLKEQLLRARAEFDNYRKRTVRETEQMRKTAARGIVRDLLPVLDNLDRALDHLEDKSHALAEGMEMVKKQFIDVLNAHGVEAIPALGEAFDPNVHEALTHQPSEEYPADVVAVEFQRGYTMGGQVLRPAKVVVSSGPADPGGESGQEAK